MANPYDFYDAGDFDEIDLDVCKRCGFFTDGVKTCGYCGEPKCPVCGCYCGGGEFMEGESP